jgi:hypothetical protein
LGLAIFAIWALSGFGYPAEPLPYALNVVSKILALITALSMFLPARVVSSASRQEGLACSSGLDSSAIGGKSA